MYKLEEERDIKPKTFAHLVSSTLYEKRFYSLKYMLKLLFCASRFGSYFVEPCIAGLDVGADGAVEPFICSTDVIGCINFAKDFVVCGTASPNLYGMCESLWEPNLVCFVMIVSLIARE